MITLKRLLCSVMLFLFVSALHAQNSLCRVRIYPPDDRAKRNEILAFLQVDHFRPNIDKSIDLEISQEDLARLKRSPYRYTVLVPDMSKYLDSVNGSFFRRARTNAERVAIQQSGGLINNIIATPSAFQVKATFAGYYRFTEMEAAIDALVTTYPSIAKKQSIGKTVGNRDLWVVKISDNVATDESEPECFFMGLQHAREAIGGSSMIFFMQYLCEQYTANNTKIKELVANREIYIMPCFNPDGWEYNYTSTSGSGGGSWRKNRDANGDGTFGVDLNRNWGVDWGNCSAPIQGTASSCGTSTTSMDTYYGPSAFSELETQALRAFTKTRRFAVAFDQHAYGPYYSIPPGRESLHNTPGTQMTTKDSNFYKAVPALMGKYNGMRTANSFDALGYEVAGGFKDWMLNGELGVGTKDTVWGMTGEGGAGDGNAAFGSMSDFWAPASEIVTLCKGMCYQNLQLAFAAGTYAELEDATDIALTAKSGSLSFNLTRVGIGNNSVTVSLLPLQNVSSTGTPVTLSSMSYYQTFTGSVSYNLPAALPNGQRVKFIWKVQADGITYYDTVVKIFNPTQLFYDDMEGTLSTKWSTATSGAGASGFGYNYTSGTWVYTTGGFGGSKALSESANGTKYTGSTRSIVRCLTAFDLSNATSAYLSFWTRYLIENFRDKVQVQISTDGSTWTPIKGTGTVQEPGITDGSTLNGQPALTGIKDTWTQEVFDLDAYRGFNSVQLRFVFTSDNDPTSFSYERDEGIFIDNLKVIKTTSALVILPVKFLSFTGALQTDNTVRLQWTVAGNQNNSRYEVERSTDGATYTRIGTVTNNEALSFVDGQPAIGANYYRLRQVDRDGQFVYSHVVAVNVKPLVAINTYPNPFSGKLTVQLTAEKSGQASVLITDANGRAMYQASVRLNGSTQELKIDTQGWPAQLYMLKVTGSNNTELGAKKLMKN